MDGTPNKDSIHSISRAIGGVGNDIKYQQQTFLGASIANFSISAGFGSSASTLGVELAEDEFNGSDGKPRGQGADVYHRGNNPDGTSAGDRFFPPTVGAPVYFSFGEKRAKVEDSYWNVYSDLYGFNNFRNNGTTYYGSDHFTFGGILKTYTQNKNATGSAMYSVQLEDPRELLANYQLILSNYAGTTYNNSNLCNIYGFLEHNTVFSDDLLKEMLKQVNYGNTVQKEGSNALRQNGGWDAVWNTAAGRAGFDSEVGFADVTKVDFQTYKPIFPFTGTGFARRTERGIPWYRIASAINYLAGWWGEPHEEYRNAGFGGSVNFRKLDYVIDFSSLPPIDPLYFFDYEQISLLDLALEICELTNCDLFVSLLPIINHPAINTIYTEAQNRIKKEGTQIGGIIKLQAISRSNASVSSAGFHKIRDYITKTQNNGIPVSQRDVGYELTNTTTDKFLVGGNEIDMHYFNTYLDRNTGPQETRLPQYTLETSLMQQVLPYYGLLTNSITGEKMVTIPKGFGKFQQILLETKGLFVAGVGDYYVTTESELRACLISYDRWVDFLMQYNDTYMEATEGNDITERANLRKFTEDQNVSIDAEIPTTYEVTCPRCLFAGPEEFDDNLPVSSCYPPFGYPLYWKRATQLGVPQAGLTSVVGANTKLVEWTAKLQNAKGKDRKRLINSILTEIQGYINDPTLPNGMKAFYKKLKSKLQSDDTEGFALMKSYSAGASAVVASGKRFSAKAKANSMRVYNFLKKIADECLGQKFLVKLPRVTNRNYDATVNEVGGDGSQRHAIKGPYCFQPRTVTNDAAATVSFDDFAGIPQYEMLGLGIPTKFLDPDNKETIEQVTDGSYYGALDGNKNAFNDKYEFNYKPVKEGGYLEYDLAGNIFGSSAANSPAIKNGFLPADPKVLLNDDNRVSAYVRIDNSQLFSFDAVGDANVTQQAIQSQGGFTITIPDVSYAYENYSESKTFNPDEDQEDLPVSFAFVKCDVDEELYLAPATTLKELYIYGYAASRRKYEPPLDLRDPQDPCQDAAYLRLRSRYWYPTSARSERNTKKIIDFHPLEMPDPNHAYALITLPGRVIPTKTTRYNESMSMKYNAHTFARLLKQDTEILQGGGQYFPAPDFEEEGSIQFGTMGIPQQMGNSFGDVTSLSADQKIMYEKTFEGLTFGCFNRINVSSPSPVYPDMVAIPLESTQRCYGPWSTTVTSAGKVGGKIEFIKNEDLTPWNYKGYDLMDEAAKIEVDLSESIQLMTERGGFTMVAAPSGLSLATALTEYGPLVSNINTEVSTNGVKTTVKMDLFSTKFGKLQKQMTDQLDTLSRERQKLSDLRNKLIRQGLGKLQRSANYSQIYEEVGNDFDRGGTASFPSDTFMRSGRPSRYGNGNPGFGSDGSLDIPYNYTQDGSMMSTSQLSDGMDILGDNAISSYYHTASLDISADFDSVSLEPRHPSMTSSQYKSTKRHEEFYSGNVDGDGNQQNNITYWG